MSPRNAGFFLKLVTFFLYIFFIFIYLFFKSDRVARVQMWRCDFKASNALLLCGRVWHIRALLYLLVLVSTGMETQRFHMTQNPLHKCLKQWHAPLFWQWLRWIKRKAHFIIFSFSSLSSSFFSSSIPSSSYFFSLLNYLRCWLNGKVP